MRFVLARAEMHYRLGLALLLAGFLVVLGCSLWSLFFHGSSATGLGTLLAYVIGSGGFALVLAGAVFFTESRAFLRRNRPVA